jgi:hypothetical protein
MKPSEPRDMRRLLIEGADWRSESPSGEVASEVKKSARFRAIWMVSQAAVCQ